MKNKKGFMLAEETLKIIIAVICIGFLIYLLVSLYFANKDAQNLKFADATLNQLVGEINKGSTSFEVYNPTSGVVNGNWLLATFPNQDISTVPQKCSNLAWNECICICGVRTSLLVKSVMEACNKKGVCLELKNYQVDLSQVSLVGGTFEGRGTFYISQNMLNLVDSPTKLSVDQLNKKITISQ